MGYTGKALETILTNNSDIFDGVTVISHEWYTEEDTENLPRIELNQLETEPILVKSGSSGQEWESWEVEIFDTTADHAKELADAVETALDDFTGTEEEVTFKTCLLMNRQTDNETKSIIVEFKMLTQ